MAKPIKHTCPNCGNRNQNLIQDNGTSAGSSDYTLLCVARVNPKAWAFAPEAPPSEMLDEKGLVACSMTWCPNA